MHVGEDEEAQLPAHVHGVHSKVVLEPGDGDESVQLQGDGRQRSLDQLVRRHDVGGSLRGGTASNKNQPLRFCPSSLGLARPANCRRPWPGWTWAPTGWTGQETLRPGAPPSGCCRRHAKKTHNFKQLNVSCQSHQIQPITVMGYMAGTIKQVSSQFH